MLQDTGRVLGAWQTRVPLQSKRIDRMRKSNQVLQTFEGAKDGAVPLPVVMRWLNCLRSIPKLRGVISHRINFAGKAPWALAAPDGSITVYQLSNLIGQPILACPTADLWRLEEQLRDEHGVSSADIIASMRRAAVFAMYGDREDWEAVSFANKSEMRAYLEGIVEARRQAHRERAAEKEAADETSPEPFVDENPSSASPPDEEDRLAEVTSASDLPPKKKRTVSAVSPASPVLPSEAKISDPPVDPPAKPLTTLPPPAKKQRPPLPGPVHSSPAVFPASTPAPPGPPKETALSPPSDPAPTPPAPAPMFAFSEADRIAAAKHVASRAYELESLRLAHEAAVRDGAGAFLALDVEAWEFDHDLLLEFGWSVVEYVKDEKTGEVSERRETQHVVVKENAQRRNRKFAPDARDHFDFGRTITLPQDTIFHLLSGLFSALSAEQPLFLVFHDPRMDLSALRRLGFAPSDFRTDLRRLNASAASAAASRTGEHGLWVVDTQALFSGWLKRKSQIGLERACKEIALPTQRLHNAGNDARYTLDLFEHMMDRANKPSTESSLIKMLDERAIADATAKQRRLETGSRILKEKLEQKALRPEGPQRRQTAGSFA